MAYAYFKPDGTLISISANTLDYPEASTIEIEVSDVASANAIYLDLDTMTVHPKQPFYLSISLNTVSGLPVGTVATLPEGQYVVDDGSLEFDADVSGTLIVYLDHPRFLSRYVEVPTGPEE